MPCGTLSDRSETSGTGPYSAQTCSLFCSGKDEVRDCGQREEEDSAGTPTSARRERAARLRERRDAAEPHLQDGR